MNAKMTKEQVAVARVVFGIDCDDPEIQQIMKENRRAAARWKETQEEGRVDVRND